MVRQLTGWLAFVVMTLDLYLIFIWAPVEKTLGIVQKIFYFHVGTAWVGFFAFFIVFVFSIFYLKTGEQKWDRIAASSAEIGTVFTTVVLITGPIWARSSWNTWWTWEPRLTTSLILWFIYLAYIMVRVSSADQEKKARLSAVFGILGFINVPLVFISIKWWSVAHPLLIEKGKFNLDPDMMITLLVSVASFSLLYVYLMGKAVTISRMQEETGRLKSRLRDLAD